MTKYYVGECLDAFWSHITISACLSLAKQQHGLFFPFTWGVHSHPEQSSIVLPQLLRITCRNIPHLNELAGDGEPHVFL